MASRVVKVGTYKAMDSAGGVFTIEILQRLIDDGSPDRPSVTVEAQWHRMASSGNRVKINADRTLEEEKTGRKMRRIE
jgi:hypothetical protein